MLDQTHSLSELKDHLTKFSDTGEFESMVLGKYGFIKDQDNVKAAAKKLGVKDFRINFEVKVASAGAAPNIESIQENTAPKNAAKKLFEVIKPTIIAVDDDYRQRAGKPVSSVTKASVLYCCGEVDPEKAEHIDSQPHVDGMLDALDLYYLGVIGQTSLFYPGKFKVVDKKAFLSNYDILEAQVKKNKTNPESPQSGEIVLSSWCTVHSSPGKELLGQQRVLLKVTYLEVMN